MRTRFPKPLRLLFLLWGISLLASTATRALRGFTTKPDPTQQTTRITVDDTLATNGETTLAYRSFGDPQASAILLLHGNPVAGRALYPLATTLAETHHVLVPDLPGFGFSGHNLTEFSAINQVSVLLPWLDQLGIDATHIIAYSQGGAPALELAQRAPERVRSLSLIASVGLQEHELLGSYELNQPIYALYYAAAWSARWLLPHFGRLDAPAFNTRTVLNFVHTDLRRNRARLRALDLPTLILHSPADTFVPYHAARAHAELVPHAHFHAIKGGHMGLLRDSGLVHPQLKSFLNSVEAGNAYTRNSPLPDDRAHQPGNQQTASQTAQHTLTLTLSLLLFLMVFASEDLACIAGGILAATGAIPLWAAIAGCLAGIWVSDVLLYALGACFGNRVLNWGPFKRFADSPETTRLRSNFATQGLKIVFITRFIPGSRVPTYLIAGTLRLGIVRFSTWLLLAAAVWTPILVGIAYFVGHPLIDWWEREGLRLLPQIALVLLALYFTMHTLTKSLTYRGRAELRGRWRRLTHWEYWPALPIYLPVFIYACWLAIRYRSATLWGLCNPGIDPVSGLAMESKSAILRQLNAASGKIPHWTLLPESSSANERLHEFLQFKTTAHLDWPIVFKPDVGQRGEGVAIIRSEAEAARYLDANPEPIIVQAYVSGEEFGVFYTRMPGESTGSIFSITHKQLPELIGDGQRTVEQLILDDPRAVAQADHYLRVNAAQLDRIPATDETIQLVELGTHCRGALFLDGNQLATPALTAALDQVVDGFDGFGFGRFDLRVTSSDALQQGLDFKILELNGVSSESTDIYDPSNSLLAGWGKLCRQWARAFQIGDAYRTAGHQPPRVRDVLAVIRSHRQREHFEAASLAQQN